MITIIVPFHLVFAQALIGGYPLLLLISEKDAGKGFMKLMAVLFVCFLILAYLFGKFYLIRQNASPSFFIIHNGVFVCLFVVFLLQPFTQNPARALKILRLGAAGALAAALMLIYSYSALSLPSGRLFTFLFFIVTLESSLFLGASGLGMVFGHWYLVKPKMSLDPFKRLTLVFLVCAAAQFLLSVLYAVSYFFNFPLFEAHGLSRLFRFSDLGIFLVFRFVLGTLTSLVIAYLTYATLSSEAIPKINRTRAATGLFYIAILSAFTGELIGKYLFWVTKIPL